MKEKSKHYTSQPRLTLGNGFHGKPPGGPVLGTAAVPPRSPGLTEKFNAAANPPKLSEVVARPVSKQQIEDLRKKMSQPRPSLDYGTRGSVNKARNAAADRRLLYTMAALTEQLTAKKGLKNDFALAAKKGELKRTFNRSSNGLGM